MTNFESINKNNENKYKQVKPVAQKSKSISKQIEKPLVTSRL